MIGQTALLIELSDGSCRHVPLDHATEFVGALDACLDATQLLGDELPGSPRPAPFVLGCGPLAGTSIPGCSHLTIAAQTLLSDAPQLATLAGGGLLLDAIERSPIVLTGRAAQPSALLVRRRAGTIETRLLPLRFEGGPNEQPTRTTELLATLVRQLDCADDQTLLLTGPAAGATAFGALLLAQVRDGQASPLLDTTRQAGFGSTLRQRHQLLAVCLSSDRSAASLVGRSLAPSAGLAARFAPQMSSRALEQATAWEIDGRLLDGGPALQQLEAGGSELLSFNATSIYCSAQQRDDLYERALRPHLIDALRLSLGEPASQHLDCGAPCPLACRKISAGTLRDFEPHALLGPQLGVFERGALDSLVQRCMELGFDVGSAAGLLGWLLERLAREELSPQAVGLRQSPRWSPADFDAAGDSRHNAQLAQTLLEALLNRDWTAPLRGGLRQALATTGKPSADWALLVELGDVGEVAPGPTWSLGNLAPSPLPGGEFSYQGRHFLPPRLLGRACARRLTAQLGLANHGLCTRHRVWLEALYPSLLAELYDWPDAWLARHRRLAHRLVRGTGFRCWTTARSVDFVHQRLRNHQLDGAPDGELDSWVRRFARGPAAAARAFWSETLAGLTEDLAS